MKPVESSNISHIGYDPEKKVLSILYKSGGQYDYHDVSPEAYAALEDADSLGQHVAKHIKGKFSFTKTGGK